MKHARKLLCLFLTLVMILEMFPVNAVAQAGSETEEKLKQVLERLDELEKQLEDLTGGPDESEDMGTETEEAPSASEENAAEETESGEEQLPEASDEAETAPHAEPEETAFETEDEPETPEELPEQEEVLRGASGEERSLCISGQLWWDVGGKARPIKSGEEIDVSITEKVTGIYVEPELRWADGSTEGLPTPSEDGTFEYLWLCAPGEAEHVSVYSFFPLSETAESWLGLMEKLGVKSYAELLDVLDDYQGWTDDARLPLFPDEAVASAEDDGDDRTPMGYSARRYACAIRWVSWTDKRATACGSTENFVKLLPTGEVNVEQPTFVPAAELPDMVLSNVTGGSVGYTAQLCATASYGVTEIQYQWYLADERDYTGAPIEGETGDYLNLRPQTVGAEAYYYCVYSFVDFDGVTETYYTNVARVFTSAATVFTLQIGPGRLYGGDLSGVESPHSYNYRPWLDPELRAAYDEPIDTYYQSMEQESLLSAVISYGSVAHCDYLTLQWFRSATPDYTDGGTPLSEVYTATVQDNLAPYDQNRALINCSVVCPNDSLEPYYVTAVLENHYTEGGVEYVTRSTDVGRVVTVAQNEQLYRVSEQGWLTCYNGHEDVMVFPESVNGVSVHGLEWTLWGRAVGGSIIGPRKIVLPDSYAALPDFAFRKTVTLEEAVLGSGLQSIGEEAFFGTNLSSINFPDTLRTIGDEAFTNTHLSGTLVLPAALAEVGVNCFWGTDFERIEFADDSFPTLGSCAFSRMPELRSVKFPANAQGELTGDNTFARDPKLADAENIESMLNIDWGDDFLETPLYGIMVDGVLTDGQFTYEQHIYQHLDMEDHVVESFTGYFARYTGEAAEELVFPASYRGEPVIGTLNPAVPDETKAVLKSVTLPSGYLYLTGFDGCTQLESMNFADLTELRCIPDRAFKNCYRLASPVVLQSESYVGTEAFLNCFSIPSLTANGAVLCSQSFNYCYSLRTFDENYCGKKTDYALGYQNFNYTALYTEKPLYCGLSRNSYGDPIAAEGAPMLYVTGKWAYTGTPEDATLELCMDPWAERVEFPGTLENANGQTFRIKTVGSQALTNLQPERLDLVVGEGIEDFDLTTGNSGGANDLTNPSHRVRSVSFPSTLHTLHENQFYNCAALEELSFAQGCALTVLPENAFYSCTGLTALDLSGLTALETLEHRCFAYCSALETVTLPEPSAIKRFVGSPFGSCKSLREINLESLTELLSLGDGGAFTYSALRTVDLSNSLKLEAIPRGCFQNSSKLTAVRLPENGVLREIGESAFSREYLNPLYIREEYNPDALVELNLPDTVETIGERAFKNCFFQNAAKEPFVLHLPASLTRLGGEAFACEYDERRGDGALFLANFTLDTPELPGGLSEIGSGEYCFGPFDNARITELHLPPALTAIPENAFANLRELRRVVFLDGLTAIGENAFGCYIPDFGPLPALAELVGFDTLTTLESVRGFNNVPLNASPLVIPDCVKTIEAWAFSSCGAEEIVVPAGVESVGRFAFGQEQGEIRFPMAQRTVTFLDPNPALPVIDAELLHYDETDDSFQWYAALTPVTIRCYEGSAAHTWALAHNEANPNNPYDIELLEAEPGLYVNLLLPDGNLAPAEAYELIEWTDSEGSPVGEGAYIEDFTPGETYSLRIVPSVEYDFRYRFEEKTVTLTAGETGGARQPAPVCPAQLCAGLLGGGGRARPAGDHRRGHPDHRRAYPADHHDAV